MLCMYVHVDMLHSFFSPIINHEIAMFFFLFWCEKKTTMQYRMSKREKERDFEIKSDRARH